MNHLAHFFLSCNDDDIAIGNFVADYMKPAQLALYPIAIRKGVKLHRQIDTFTDAHPDIAKIKAIVRPKHRRYASVLVDVYCDYLLVQHWDKFADMTLSDFTHQVYRLLLSRKQELPPILSNSLEYMIADNWLMLFGTKQGLEKSFRHLAKRSSRPQWFEGGADTLFEHYDAIEEHFLDFFPQLSAYVRTQCAKVKD